MTSLEGWPTRIPQLVCSLCSDGPVGSAPWGRSWKVERGSAAGKLPDLENARYLAQLVPSKILGDEFVSEGGGNGWF
jgi:hypothetical protein